MEREDSNEIVQVREMAEVEMKEMRFFNEKAEIVKEEQPHQVAIADKKSLHQIVSPYLHKFAVNTKEVASNVGNVAYEAIKQGFLWIYNKFVDNVIPYAVENLPKILFVAKKEEKPFNVNSTSFEVLGVEGKDYDMIPNNKQQVSKTLLVIPLGTNNDKNFEQFLKKEKYEINYSYPIDIESEDKFQAKESFMMPSQSFQAICEGVKESYAQLQLEQANKKKVAFKLQNCFIFELQGQNSNEFDMLDEIEKNENTKVGYIVVPEQTLRRSLSDETKDDPIAQLVSGKEAKVEITYEQEKVVDRERKVRVDINPRPKRPEADLLLN